MNLKQKIIQTIKNPLNILVFLNNRKILILPDKTYLKIRYKIEFNKKLDFDNVHTYTEKLQWLKIYDRKPEYTKMVDKYEARQYVADKIGKEHLIPLIGIYEKFDDIDFEKLPEQFVIKCTHDSGSVIICKNKTEFNIKKAKKKINKCLKRNIFWSNREWPYKDVKPRIIIEKYIADESKTQLKDYKIYCFNGKAKMIEVISDRFTDKKETYFDKDWNLMDLKEVGYENDMSIKKPVKLEHMIQLAEILSKNIAQLRVDFYCDENEIYFGELTFFSGAGFEKYEPKEYDLILGDMLELPEKTN